MVEELEELPALLTITKGLRIHRPKRLPFFINSHTLAS
jgi:hypothetical protein